MDQNTQTNDIILVCQNFEIGDQGQGTFRLGLFYKRNECVAYHVWKFIFVQYLYQCFKLND